jgi:diaminopimelate decarboxylase
VHHFHYEEGRLYCEDVPLERIAGEVGTPCYVYSYATLVRHYRVMDEAFSSFPHLICFAVKANSNLAVLRALAREGSGMDIVSGGELFRALRAGVHPGKVVFAGVGKTPQEMEYALRMGILMFNVESEQELETLQEVACRLDTKAPVALRVNPDVDPKTHPYISTGLKKSKFGISIEEAVKEYEKAMSLPCIEVKGVHCHIGSQITQVSPFVDALERILLLVEELRDRGVDVTYVDMGGGLGIQYKDEDPPPPSELARAVEPLLRGKDLTLILEPGRVIAGNAGILLTKVLYLKKGEAKNFVVVDAAMNDLARPSLYGAYHAIWPVREKPPGSLVADVVGPICESGDFLAQDRELPLLERGDLLAVMSAGAYGFTMSSNYNSRPRVAEVMVKGGEFWVVRERETYEDLVRGERIPPFLLEG